MKHPNVDFFVKINKVEKHGMFSDIKKTQGM
jgi:hypothetical protein